jgi:hypothetical protein
MRFGAVLNAMSKIPTIDVDSFPTLEKFARTHNLRRAVLRDSCGEQLIILGKPPKPRPEDCSHIFDNGDGRLGVSILVNSARAWRAAKDKLIPLGFELHQNGDTEGTLLFDPENEAQSKAAKKIVKAKRAVRPMTDEQRAVAAARLNVALKR